MNARGDEYQIWLTDQERQDQEAMEAVDEFLKESEATGN